MNHMEFAALESRSLSDSNDWEAWCAKVERLLGRSLDGNQAVDGFSLDFAFDAYCDLQTPQQYFREICNAIDTHPDNEYREDLRAYADERDTQEP